METIPSPEIASPEQKTVRSAASRCAFAVILFQIFASLAMLPVSLCLGFLPWSAWEAGWANNLERILDVLAEVPALLVVWAILFRTIPKAEAPSERLPFSIGRLAFFLPCMILVSYVGGMITEIPGFFGVPLYSATALAFRGVSIWVMVLSAVVFAPVVEELLFRKFMLDRLSGFHPMTAILFTALLFGLAHGNLEQFVGAFLDGILLGIVYYRTQNVVYPILLHATSNGLAVLSGVISNEWVVHGIYLALGLIGLFLLIRYRKQFLPIPSGHPRYGKAFFANAGWIVVLILFGASIIVREVTNIISILRS